MSPNLFSKGVALAYETYSKDVGKSLIHWGSVGWLFSSLAQIFAIGINKNIDKKEKKFLIPQEIADGLVNVGLYYTVTQAVKTLGDRLVESGRFIKKDTFDFLKNLNTNNQPFKDFIKNVGEGSISKIFEKIKAPGKLPIVAAFNNTDSAIESFGRWKNGVGTLFTIGASILACNVITPYCRNKIASKFQQRHINKTGINPKPMPVRPYTFSRISPTFNAFKI